MFISLRVNNTYLLEDSNVKQFEFKDLSLDFIVSSFTNNKRDNNYLNNINEEEEEVEDVRKKRFLFNEILFSS